MSKIKKLVIETDRKKLTVFLVLRFFVILTMILQFINGNYANVVYCILTLVLFAIPTIVNNTLKIELPNLLESIIYIFIFAAEILGEIQNFYGIIPEWDTMLHTINGFLCGAIGFSLIDILNQHERFHITLTPIFVAMISFCFSMTVGVVWEFIEYGADNILMLDMQKDTIIQNVNSVALNEDGHNEVVKVNDIEYTIIYTKDKEIKIDNGYLDIGLKDTMKDLVVNFIGATVFSILGWLYIKNRDGYKFTENFIPRLRKWKKESN